MRGLGRTAFVSPLDAIVRIPTLHDGRLKSSSVTGNGKSLV